MQTSNLSRHVSPRGLHRLTAAGLALLAVGCTREGRGRSATSTRLAPDSPPATAAPASRAESSSDPRVIPGKREVATLAGGCFWGMEELLRNMPGVLETVVGYTGGNVPDATYGDVKTGRSGHAEAVRIVFDPSKISYEEILLEFFRLHDPTTLNRQGNDVGTQYRSAIFYHSEEQKDTAEVVKQRVEDSGAWDRPIVTEVVAAGPFYDAEDYHQDYLQKNPGGYTCHFRRPLSF